MSKNARIACVGLLLAALILIGFWYFVRLQMPMATSSSGTTGTSTAQAAERLTVSGGQILAPDGKPIDLTGFNWGNDLTVSTSSPNDGADNAAQGANVVRIPVRWWLPTDKHATKDLEESYDPNSPQTGYISQALLHTIDQDVQLAAANHLWVDLFMKSGCGSYDQTGQRSGGSLEEGISECGGITVQGQKVPANFINDPTMLARYVDAWDFLATRYKNQPYIGMYEIASEPFFCSIEGKLPTCEQFTAQFYKTVINSVHAIDPRTPFLIGADQTYSANLTTALQPLYDYMGATTTPIIYTADLLDGASHNPSRVQAFVSFRQTNNVPFFVQQVLVVSKDSDATSTAQAILSALNNAGIGWTWWEYRNAGPGESVWFLGNQGKWTEQTDWLAVIASYFKGAKATMDP